jgi:hypothetical protein
VEKHVFEEGALRVEDQEASLQDEVATFVHHPLGRRAQVILRRREMSNPRSRSSDMQTSNR